MNKSERAAEDLLRRFGCIVPIQIEEIATKLGLEIVRQPMEDSVSGMLIIKQEGGTIGVNENHHPNRQRFSIAHELGHYILHRNDMNVFLDTSPIFFRDESSADGSKVREIEANHFAAEILMPREVLVPYIRQEIGFDPSNDLALKRLAGYFGVSTQALLIRLTRLDLIDG